MSQSVLFENKALQNPSSPMVFNLVPQANSFNAVFNTKPLDEKESEEIQKLLLENIEPEQVNEQQFENDLTLLKSITSEIKAIGKQAIILTGERVFRAKEILKPYKDGTFTQWLVSTFGNRKTGYNMLSYYEFYMSLPNEQLREKFQKLPQKTAYILASRQIAAQESIIKHEIIESHYQKKHDELLEVIQERLPASEGDKRAKISLNLRLIKMIKTSVSHLRKRKRFLSQDEKNEINKIIEDMMSLSDV